MAQWESGTKKTTKARQQALHYCKSTIPLTLEPRQLVVVHEKARIQREGTTLTLEQLNSATSQSERHVIIYISADDLIDWLVCLPFSSVRVSQTGGYHPYFFQTWDQQDVGEAV
jgi:hypothetical protein